MSFFENICEENMNKKNTIMLIVLMFVGCSQKNTAPTSVEGVSSTTRLINFSSKNGMDRFSSSKFKKDFFKLSNHFESQTNKVYCGPTSAVIVLNALRQEALRGNNIQVRPDESLVLGKNRSNLSKSIVFNRYTFNNVFENVGGIKTSQQVLGAPMTNGKADWGFQLAQLNYLFQAHGLTAEAYPITEKITLERVKTLLIDSFNDVSNFVLVNYSRKSLDQKGGGHISPLGAYDQDTDSFLIMDVNPNKADWVWVTAKDLYSAMNTFDTVENRGFIMVSN